MRAFALVAAVTAVLLAACGNTEIGNSKAKVIADARHARDSASSVLVSGIFRDSTGHDTSVHLWVANGKGEAGWVWTNYPNYRRRGWGNYDLRVIGTDLYIRGNFAAIARSHGDSNPPRGAWLKASTTSGPLAKLYALVAPSQLFPMLDADPHTLTDRGWSNFGDNNYDNHAIVDIRSKDGGQMLIRANGTPYPDSMTWDNLGDELEFSNWNAPVPITPPKGALPASRFGLG